MLLFSTILEVKDWVSFDDFIRLVLEWNEGSKYAENRVVGIDWHGEHCARYGESNLWLEMIELSEEKVLAIRHEKITADGVAWDSDFVLNLSERRISIRLDRTYREEALVIGAKFSTPHFITLLIEHGFVRDDGELPVLRTPMYVSDEHLPICENVFRNMGGYRLPVVFVSKTANDDDPLSVAWLASRLKGAAHVLVEESMERCREIRRRFFRAEMPYGAVRIFYPSETVGKKKFFFRSATGDMDRRLENVIQNVIYYGISQRIDRLFTWQGVSGAVLREELRRQIDVRKNAENARQEAEEEVARVYETFGDDLEALEERVEALTKENEALQAENQGLRAKFAIREQTPIVFMGDEEDFYPGEIRDMVLETLSEVLGTMEKLTRRRNVLEDSFWSHGDQKRRRFAIKSPCGRWHASVYRKQSMP